MTKQHQVIHKYIDDVLRELKKIHEGTHAIYPSYREYATNVRKAIAQFMIHDPLSLIYDNYYELQDILKLIPTF